MRGYLLKDGNLHLSLMADGGIDEWRPRPSAALVLGDPAQPLAGRVLGRAVHTRDAAELRFHVLRVLTDRFASAVLAAVRNCGNLAAESAGRHGCKREDAALTAMPQRTRPSAASRVCCAGLAPALDPAPGRQFSCPVFWRRQISAVFGSH